MAAYSNSRRSRNRMHAQIHAEFHSVMSLGVVNPVCLGQESEIVPIMNLSNLGRPWSEKHA